jgi:hypothetical protein
MASFIKFLPAQPKPKTKVWTVVTFSDETILGRIAWFGRWRCYCFFAESDTIFEKTCLRDIADFCEKQTKLKRKESTNVDSITQ